VAEDPAQYDLLKTIADLEREMVEAADALEFERAAMLRDELRELERLACDAPAARPAAPAGKTVYPAAGPGRRRQPRAPRA
jgi:excinuclease ABC subunit B